jgi:hypothetical protein
MHYRQLESGEPLDSFIMSDEIKVYVLFEKGKVTDVRVKHFQSCL